MSEQCKACMGNVMSGKSCYACGLKGPAGQGWALKVVELEQEIMRLKAGRRRAAQLLIAEIGAPGPEDIEETAARAAEAIALLRVRLGEGGE